MNLKEEQEDFTDKLLELGLKLKAAESQIEALRSNYEKELSKFAHNLKNPVGVVSSFAEMLKGSSSVEDEKSAKYLDVIQSASRFSLDLITSFQEYSTLTNALEAPDLQEVSVIDFISGLISEVSEILKRRNQSIQLKSNCSPEAVLNLDRDLFRIALFNIIQNASRFSEEHTAIQIALDEFEDHITIRISDGGIGISSKDLASLTDAFFTVNTYDVHKEKCIGLGLSKTAIALKKMDATLSFSSQPDRGTKVQIGLKKDN